ncbi:hypothetical protein D2Q93_15120 [Alicyclobacillaceae bacterium I2511]|nr:hypothetical protein D2Q93_15120 [Alicyclobacillaceae bacterium I2511]
MDALCEASLLKQVVISNWSISDLELIGIGAFLPLRGFATEADWNSVLDRMHLTTGEVWTIPITLPISEHVAKSLRIHEKIVLADADGTIYGTMAVKEIYLPDKAREAETVYQTLDREHPGVRKLFNSNPYYVAGPIVLLNRKKPDAFAEFYMDPVATRAAFASRGWKQVVGFQTRNPVHRAHEHIQKSALEIVDGLFLNPLVGETKADDIPVDVRMRSYAVLLEHYYPKDRVLFRVCLYCDGGKSK